MPVVPAPGEVTVCEINRIFLTKLDDADNGAQEAYSKILGRVFRSIPFRFNQPENGFRNGHSSPFFEEDRVRGALYSDSSIPSTSDRSREVIVDEDTRGGFFGKQLSAVKNYFFSSLHNLMAPYPEVQLTYKSERFQAVSWHKHKLWLAFISSASQVLVHNFEDPESRDPIMLANDSMRGVEAIEWRPNGGPTLCVACRGGICIWSASFPGNTAPVRAGVASFSGTQQRGIGPRWSVVDFLKSQDGNPVTCMSWSPNGRLLAAASRHSSVITVWDTALGEGTPVRRGFGGISLLKWSPTGDYLLSSKLNGAFHLWETNTWTAEPWASAGGSLVSTMWGPDGHVLLVAFDRVLTLAALYFPSRPPSLDVHLLPVEFPELEAITGRHGSVEKLAWDGTGERLALSFAGGDPAYEGLIAICDTRHVPIVSTTLIGFIRGPGFGAKPLAFAFHDKLKQGSLLAVCWSTGVCCTYPLLFRFR